MKFSKLFLMGALFLTAISTYSQKMYPRKTIVEEFTSEFVVDCGIINPAADPILDSKNPMVIPIKVHTNTNNSKLAMENANNYGRPVIYFGQNVNFPYGSFAVNGSVVPFSTSLGTYINSLQSAVESYDGAQSVIKITVLEDRKTDPTKIEVCVIVESDVELDGTQILYMNMNEDNISNGDVGGTNGETTHRWVSRGFYPNVNIGNAFTLKKGMKGFYFTVLKDAKWNMNNLRAIGWVQNSETNEILQAEVTSKPAQEVAMAFADSSALHFDKTNAKNSQEIGFQNRGMGYMNIPKIEITGADADKFELIYNNTITRIHPGERLPVRVKLKTTAKGTYTAKLIVHTNAVNTPDLEIPINAVIDGDILFAEIKANVNKLEFGDISTYSDKLLSISNSGNSTLEIARAILLDNDTTNFRMLSGDFPDRLLVGQRYDCVIRFIPTEDVEYFSNLEIYSNAQTYPKFSIDLRGAGKDALPFADFIITKDSVVFGKSNSIISKKIIFSNIGTMDMKITAVDFLNDAKKVFSLGSEKVVTIPKDTHHEMVVNFAPKEEGTFTAQMLVSSNALKPNNFKKFYLSGVGDNFSSVREEVVNNELGISLSPSPAYNILNISLKEQAKADFIRIYNSAGTIVKEIKDYVLTSGESGIVVTDLPIGAYIVLVNADGKLSQEKFTIKR